MLNYAHAQRADLVVSDQAVKLGETGDKKTCLSNRHHASNHAKIKPQPMSNTLAHREHDEC